MNGLQPFESTIEQTTETMPPSHKTITAAAMTTNRFTSFRELLHYWKSYIREKRLCSKLDRDLFLLHAKSFPIPTFFQRGILEQLDAGEVIVGDGGMCYALEKRGYVKAGPWTPECTVEHPEAGQLFRISRR